MTEWTQDPVEAVALEEVRSVIAGMVAVLASVSETRYVDPAGGFVVGDSNTSASTLMS